MLIFRLAIIFLVMGVAARPLAEIFLARVVRFLESKEMERYGDVRAKAQFFVIMMDNMPFWQWWLFGFILTPILIFGILLVLTQG